MLQIPTAVAKFHGQTIEQLGVRWQFALRAELFARLDDADPEDLFPVAIRDHTGASTDCHRRPAIERVPNDPGCTVRDPQRMKRSRHARADFLAFDSNSCPAIARSSCDRFRSGKSSHHRHRRVWLEIYSIPIAMSRVSHVFHRAVARCCGSILRPVAVDRATSAAGCRMIAAILGGTPAHAEIAVVGRLATNEISPLSVIAPWMRTDKLATPPIAQASWQPASTALAADSIATKSKRHIATDRERRLGALVLHLATVAKPHFALASSSEI